MAKIKIKCNSKQLERQLNKGLEKVIRNETKKIVEQNNFAGENTMKILSETEETILLIVLSKRKNNSEIELSGNIDEFPKYMHFNLNEVLEKLKILGYISYGKVFMGGDWDIILTPEARTYFKKKGMRKELFEELPAEAKIMLKNIIEREDKGENISDYLQNKIKEKEINRGIIGMLQKNGLLNVSWYENTSYHVTLTYEGRTYFEREKNYMEQMERMNRPSVNIENLTNTGVFNMGNITDSSITINNSFEEIEKEIEQKGNEDKQELKEILEEVKDYIDNINATKNVSKNTGLFKRIGKHFNKHQWFYSEIIGILGQAILLCMGNQV
jgi:uncharacterized protein YjgD (DUF1641 family)